jgi:hypothetical protein
MRRAGKFAQTQTRNVAQHHGENRAERRILRKNPNSFGMKQITSPMVKEWVTLRRGRCLEIRLFFHSTKKLAKPKGLAS